MTDNVTLNPGTGGDTIAADDVGGVKYQVVKLATGALDSATLALNGSGTATGAIRVELPTNGTGVIATVSAVTAISNALPAGNNNIGDVDVASIAAGDNNIGNVDIVTVPTDPFGANADAASATGSISAKLRFIAATGIPITGTVTVGSHAVTNAGTFVTQVDGAALTALQKIDDPVDSTLLAMRSINGGAEYETVAASQTAQVLGATGGTGDYIAGVLVVPATTSPGNVLLLDNATSITIFTGGASSVSNLVPFFIPLGMISVSGAWKLTTGTNVSCIGVGNFT